MSASRMRAPGRAALLAVGLAVIAGLLLTFDDALGRASPSPDSAVQTQPSPAPELSGKGLSGEARDLRDLRGKVVLVNIWASWCAPCREELPLLLSTAERYEEEGLRLIGVNSNDRPEEARRFLEEIDATTMVNVADPDGRHAVEWGARGVPETFVVDRRGRVVARRSGEVTADWIDAVVRPLVER